MGIGTNLGQSLQDGTFADADIVADNAIRADVRGGVDATTLANHRRGMNPCCEHGVRKKDRQHTGERHPGIGHNDERFGGRADGSGNHDGRSRARLGALEISLVFGKRQIPRSGAVRGRKPRQHQRRIAHDFSIQLLGYLGGSKRHIRFEIKKAVAMIEGAQGQHNTKFVKKRWLGVRKRVWTKYNWGFIFRA